METLIQILSLFVVEIFGLVNAFFNLVADLIKLIFAGNESNVIIAAAAFSYSDIPSEILAIVRRWRGSIDNKYSNIDNLVVIIQGHSSWGTPSVFSQVVSNRAQLSTLIPKCKSAQGSPTDRGLRDILLKTTVTLCREQVKAWATNQYYSNVMTLNDFHTLGFLLPGESGGHRSRSVPTNAIAEVKVIINSPDMITTVIDKASKDNAALTKSAWPRGVRNALIVITAADGVTEVVRLMTSRLRNDIVMPPGSRGKLFLIKAAFLKHLDDEPRFGPEPTFSMPLTTEDLGSGIITDTKK
jgi:hypothetical protein